MKSRSLKDSLAGWTGFPKLESTFEPRSTRQAAKRVAQLLQDVRPKTPANYDLLLLYRRVAAEWRRTHSLAGVSPRDLRQLPWVLFYPPLSKSSDWLGAKPSIVREYSRWLMHGRRTRSVLALLHEFLRVYPTDLTTFNGLRLALRKALRSGASPPPASLRKWVQRCDSSHLLKEDRGRQFASDLLTASGSPDELLQEAGLDTGLARCGFLESGIRSVLPKSSRPLAQDGFPGARLQRLLTVLQFEGKLRFDERSMRVEIATALLGPFVDRPPPSATKKLLQSFFLRHFGDPRLPSGKHRWSGVPDDARRVVIRWLVERAMEQFFMLLKETALDRHWRYREAFWRTLLDEGLIDDIWFVLGRRAAGVLRKMSSDPGVLETTAELHGAGSDQSVLLMRIPGVTIAEWSHNGSCHMWLDGLSVAPSLYKHRYHAYDVRYGLHSQRHHGSPRGTWQDQIARWLWESTGIELDRDRYFPYRLRETQQPRASQTVRHRHPFGSPRYRPR